MQSKTLKLDPSCNPLAHPLPTITYHTNYQSLSFHCMASPCEVLLEAPLLDTSLVEQLFATAVKEAWRIEHKYSRYHKNNTWAELHSTHTVQTIDQETQALLWFSHQAWLLSDGLFDITSGLLRRAWSFKDKSLPNAEDIKQLLQHIGWEKVQWAPNAPSTLQLPQGMELDFGGIGKEYAVDRVLALCQNLLKEQQVPYRILVNFGGDLACDYHETAAAPWTVGIETIEKDNVADILIDIGKGAIATSGDTKRFIEIEGVRYGHILNPKTGWPVTSPYRSISIAGQSCVQAGMMATFTLLQGEHAKQFVDQAELDYWLRTDDQIFTNKAK